MRKWGTIIWAYVALGPGIAFCTAVLPVAFFSVPFIYGGEPERIRDIYLQWGLMGFVPILIQILMNARRYWKGYERTVYRKKDTPSQIRGNILCIVASPVVAAASIAVAFSLLGAARQFDADLQGGPLVISMISYFAASLFLALIHMGPARPDTFLGIIKGFRRKEKEEE